MIKRNYEMEILINGRPVKEYFYNHRTYVEGRKGSVFQVRLRNNSSEKVLFVPTVDGLSVISGKDGSFDSRGYVLEPYSSMKIDGWRLNNDEIAEFYFSTVEDSYRKRQEKGIVVGSIAVAVFREKENKPHKYPDIVNVPWTRPEPIKPWIPFDDPIISPRIYDDNSAPGNTFLTQSCSVEINQLSTKTCSQDVGTGFGQTKRSEVISVTFDRENHPDTTLEVFYNSRKQLLKLGVDFTNRTQYISEPNSFPNEKGYCERPKE